VQCPILLVSAPAGFGKTTLIAEWLRHKELLAAWVSLEKADNELVRFWRYVIAALCRQQDALGKQIEVSPVGIIPHAGGARDLIGASHGVGASDRAPAASPLVPAASPLVPAASPLVPAVSPPVSARRRTGASPVRPYNADFPPAAPEAILANLTNALVDLTEDVLLVLDDYQAIRNSAIHQSMIFFLEHLPPRLHLLMITRSD